MSKIRYQKEVVAEIKRIAKKLGNTITLAQYEKHCQHKYRWELIKYRLEVGWNKLKTEAGLTLSSKGGARKTLIRKPKITRRRCNMEDINHEGKETWFDSVYDMRSCPKCTNTKLGEAYSAGMDERNLGYIG